ncbi:RNA-binding snoRNP assembly protein PWA37_004610 [Arxiozyma heterogenica]|uniref:H/ACA ribonucleoprotein complex non-core subunit NAF1 n=1 Tax=Arxiozyma heterogenica TaxID=278026 RepID=A0AAN7ZT57_9SACH|nr:hypothetical protein RI543_000895 [Kazachstania heterogenica]
MTGDLFSRALENADSITAEELKLTSLEKSEGETESQNIDNEEVEEIGDSNINEKDNGNDIDSKQDNGEVREKSNEDDQIIEGNTERDAVGVDDCIDSKGSSNIGDNNSRISEGESQNSESSDTDTSSSGEEENTDDAKDIYETGEEEDEEEGYNLNEAIRSKNEIIEEQIIEVPKNYKIDEKTKISEIGIIKSIFESNVIVQGTTSGEKRVLKDGSIFCLENREVVGTLSEVFGQLQNPFYKVGISPVDETKSEIISKIKEMVGAKIFIVVPDAHWIDTFELKRVKGTDASNGYDEELPEEEQEFSDDEKEAQFKRMMKNKKKKKKAASNTNNNDNNKFKDAHNNKVTRKKQQTSYQENTVYSKMKAPVGIVQQKHYMSRVNRHKDIKNDSFDHASNINNTINNFNNISDNNIKNNNLGMNYQNNPAYSNPSRGMYQSTANQYGHMAQQSQYNFNNFSGNYQQPFVQNPNSYPRQQYNSSNFDVAYGEMRTQGYTNVNYSGQAFGPELNYNMQHNYANSNLHFYSQQSNFQQQPLYNQNLNIYYQQNIQQAHVPQYQQQMHPPAANVTHPPNIEQIRNFHEMLLQQNANKNGNNLSFQNTEKQTSQDNDIPY